MMPTSYSEVSAFLDCRRRHHYSYIEQLERIQESAALADGKAGHTVLQAFYQAHMIGDGEYALIAARTALEESGYVFDPEGKRADLEDMLFNYYFPNEPYISADYRVLAVEKQFQIRWDDGEDEGYKFIIDLILRDPSGEIVIVDHKFTGRFTLPEMTQLMPQIPLYMAGIRAMGMPADYGEYNEINMNKVVAKRKVADAIKRTSVVPTNERIIETFRQQVEVAREINERKKLTIAESAQTAYRSIDKVKCGMCSFKSLCIGELAGSNTQLIRRTDYRKRKPKMFLDEQ